MKIYLKEEFIMAAHVLWISRHNMKPDQQAAIFPDGREIEIRKISQSVQDVADLDQDVDWADVVGVVLPPQLMTKFMEMYGDRGRPVIRTISRRRVLEDGSATFDFVRWERVKEFREVTEPWPAK